MGLVPRGHEVFEVISRYDDLLAIEGREEYEPGDTLALIVPFLVYHGIAATDIRRVSDRAYLVPGAKELVANLLQRDWRVHIVSTSYEQHALNIASKLGLRPESVDCTAFPLDALAGRLTEEELRVVGEAEQYILAELCHDDLGSGTKDHLIKPYLDWFYWERLRRSGLGVANKTIEVVGGRRKVWAIERIAVRHRLGLRDVVFVGDSITDAQAARCIEASGGLSIAFNANAYVLPYATVGVASTSLSDIAAVLQAWARGGRTEVKRNLTGRARRPGRGVMRRDWLVGKSRRALATVLKAHAEARQLVRRQAAKLG